MKIFCDFDGTLVDISERHYTVYRSIVEKFQGKPLAKNDYWHAKRQKTDWESLLQMSQLKPEVKKAFLDEFISKIENPEYLVIDKLFPNVEPTLKKLNNLGECYLVSLRRNRQNLLGQVEKLGLSSYFTDILIGHSESDGHDVKVELIRSKLNGESGMIIGDTEADVITGKKLGLRTYAVTSGIRSKEFLGQLSPDYLVPGVDKIAALI